MACAGDGATAYTTFTPPAAMRASSAMVLTLRAAGEKPVVVKLPSISGAE